MKRMPGLAALFIVSVLAIACKPEVSDPFAGTVVDLSHPLDEQTVYWPTAEPFRLEKDFEGATDKGYFYAAKRFSNTPRNVSQMLRDVYETGRGE